MNKIENKSNREMKQKSLVFETLNESDTHLERLTKKNTKTQITDIRNKIKDITTDPQPSKENNQILQTTLQLR